MGKVHDALAKADKEHKKMLSVSTGLGDRSKMESVNSVLPFETLTKAVREMKLDSNLISY